MSRLFTISFPFKGQEYTALVSLQQRQYNLSWLVRYLNKEAEAILPEGKVVFSLEGGIETPKNITNDLTEELVAETSIAISQHLLHHD